MVRIHRHFRDRSAAIEHNLGVRGHQKVIASDDQEEEIIDLMEGEQGWVRPEGELQTLADEGLIDAGDEGDLDLGDDANIDPALDDDEEALVDIGEATTDAPEEE